MISTYYLVENIYYSFKYSLSDVIKRKDYDDSYCIEYARTNNGYIVSNDRYWDHVDKQPEKARGKTIRWLRDHCVSFTFVKDNFLPNPDFKLRP